MPSLLPAPVPLPPSLHAAPALPADPKPTEGFKPLKKVKSGERWDNTRSFTSAWRSAG